LQQRIASIRSWAYIAQRPDWVLARGEMAARARAVEARLSDALHARLTERFVNRRTTVLMRKLGPDAGLLPVELGEDRTVRVDGEAIGTLDGFRFKVDPGTRAGDRKLLLAAAERHLPELLAARAGELIEDVKTVEIDERGLEWRGERVAFLERGRSLLSPRVTLDRALATLEPGLRERVRAALEAALALRTERELAPLLRIAEAADDLAAGAAQRALILRLVEAGGVVPRAAAIEPFTPEQREKLRSLGVRIGALDLFVPTLLRPAALRLWSALARTWGLQPPAAPTTADPVARGGAVLGYRKLGRDALRVDLAEKLIRVAHARRVAAPGKRYPLDPALAVSMGLSSEGYARLLRLAGFRPWVTRTLAPERPGPPAPLLWEWQPPRTQRRAPPRVPTPRKPVHAAFEALAEWGAR
jgi:ATP-dependent RNA helicase SUPV3L1/SUV3